MKARARWRYRYSRDGYWRRCADAQVCGVGLALARSPDRCASGRDCQDSAACLNCRDGYVGARPRHYASGENISTRILECRGCIRRLPDQDRGRTERNRYRRDGSRRSRRWRHHVHARFCADALAYCANNSSAGGNRGDHAGIVDACDRRARRGPRYRPISQGRTSRIFRGCEGARRLSGYERGGNHESQRRYVRSRMLNLKDSTRV